MIGWLDGGAGASGDMLIGALFDAGVELEVLRAGVDPLDLGITLRPERVSRAGLAAFKMHVEAPETSVARRLPDVLALFADLPSGIRDSATAVFERLARAEAAVHGVASDEVHFHEVGALDSIADVVATCAGFAHLGLTELHCSTLSLGNGRTSGAHGPLPVPVPAVLELLTGVTEVRAGPAPFESTTPTGAALLATLVTTWGPMPSMTIRAVGMGAGSKDAAELANVLRLVTGEPVAATPTGTAVQIDANVDDLDPRVWPTAIAQALAAGAHDAWVTPITMKKGRPAHTFSVLCAPADAAEIRAVIFAQTSTIGLREYPVARHMLERAESTVQVGGHTIRVKVASYAGDVVNRSVEWDDVAAAADALGRSTREVLAAATLAAATADDGR